LTQCTMRAVRALQLNKIFGVCHDADEKSCTL
jgi:hypothetical protein